MSDDLGDIRARVAAAHGCTSDPCGSSVCQTQRDRAALVAEVERLREQVADAWDLGVRAGWAMSGEGWNAEYPGDIDPLDELNYPNPYREETT